MGISFYRSTDMKRLHRSILKILFVTQIISESSSNKFYDYMKESQELMSPSSYKHKFESDEYNTEYEDLLPDESKDNFEEEFENQNYDDDSEESDKPQMRSYQKHSDCSIKYETVSVVKQVPSFSKHCHKVEDTKCKTIFKNSFTTKMETQCVASFDTSCDTTVETAYKQQCKTIKDVECRIVNLEDTSGHHISKKLCEDVPQEKCVPVPFKVEGQQCVNIPVQQCSNVPVTAPVEVPKEKCYKRPRKVCQTLVSTKPKVITAQVPKEHCGYSSHNSQIKNSPASAAPTLGLIPPKSSISRSFGPAKKEEESNYNDYFGENEDVVNNSKDHKDLFYYLMNKRYNN